MPLARLIFFLVLALATIQGCDRTGDTLNKARSQVATPSGRAAAAATLLAEFPPKGKMLPGNAIDHAAAWIDQVKATGNSQMSVEATAYAGAVLDAIQSAEGSLQQGPEFEIFWMKVGCLAFAAAEEAFQAGREPEAATLMLAGGARWQSEPYWLRYTSHDALVSIILARSGHRAEAIARLRSRPDLQGEAQRVLEELERAP